MRIICSSDEEETAQAVRVYGKLFMTKYQLKFGGVAQLGEHLPCKQGVRSSILLISTTSEQSRLKNKSANREFVKPPPCSSFSPKKAYGFPGGPQEE